MAHRRAKLTHFGRLLLVQRVEDLGWTPAQAAEALGVSRATAYKWLRRYRGEGEAGLEDRSSRPLTCPHTLPADVVQEILSARQRLKFGPHRLAPEVGCPRSTIYGVLRRHCLSRLDHLRLDCLSDWVEFYIGADPIQLSEASGQRLCL